MSLGCWAMAHGCPCLPTKATRPRPVKANAAGRCLAGTWGAKNSSQCLGTKPVVGKLRNRWCWRIWGYIFWIFFWNIKETSSVWASQRVLHHPMGHDQCSTKPGGDILAIRVSELTANVPLMVWRLQVTDSSSAPTCGGGARLIPLQLVMIGEYWRSKWPKRIINVENESLRVWRGMWSLAFEPTWIHAQCSACVFNLSLLAFCVFKATVRSQSPFLHGQCPANARAWCPKNKQCGNHSG